MGQEGPVHRIRLGRIRAAIWLNKNGDGRELYSVNVSRPYNNDGEWKDSTSFLHDDLPVVREIYGMAYSWIWERRAAAVAEETEQ